MIIRTVLVLFVFVSTARPQGSAEITLDFPHLQKSERVELDRMQWKYRPGDDPAWSDPHLDDRDWEVLDGTAITLDRIPKSGWHVGWFRLRINADASLAQMPLALVMVHYGASEIYLDGRLVQGFGTVGSTPQSEVAHNPNTTPVNVVLDASGAHVLAIRHSCMELRDLSDGWGRWFGRQSLRPVVNTYTNRTPNYGAGFGIRMVEAWRARDEQAAKSANGGLYLLNIGLLFAIGLLHLLLFWFYPRQRANLFFGVFACCSALGNVIYYRWGLSHQSATGMRRAGELEEARKLQLSMLPRELPQLPHLEVAAYMKPATEVGGDYYDFHVSHDHTLTIGVGDATGHGLKAGTMVSSVKSLFVSLAHYPEISQILDRMNRVLKEMKLRGLFMAMTIMKVQGQKLSFCVAGMPPVLIYREASNEVEEVMIKALPLGGMTGYQYKQHERSLATGDVVVLMSDGLPERFNEEGEMLDSQKIRDALLAVVGYSPQAIIDRLVELGDDWGGSRLQDDDVTFVVLKIR
jgi:hypothetical protein